MTSAITPSAPDVPGMGSLYMGHHAAFAKPVYVRGMTAFTAKVQATAEFQALAPRRKIKACDVSVTLMDAPIDPAALGV